MQQRRFAICLLLLAAPLPRLFAAPPPDAPMQRPVSFKLDVMPVFFRAGCNSGSCHGSARGKDGFMLSLFGYDPAGDHFRLTREIVGRRVDLAVPKQSLLLEKATGAVKHSGGKLFDEQSEYYQTLLTWIAAGALPDEADAPHVTRIELLPERLVLQLPTGESRPAPADSAVRKARVTAHYSDGTDRDVTHLALYLASNESIATIDEQATIVGQKRGGAHVFARFDKFTVGAEVIVLPAESEFVWPDPPEENYIDELVHARLEQLEIAPSPLCSDEEFLRRATIDLIGLLPTADEYRRFIDDRDSRKRARLIDALLARKEFSQLWAAKWGEVLRLRGDTNPGSGTALKAAWNYHHWIVQQMEGNVPLDQFVRALIRGTGSNFRDPASNYYNMLAQGQLDAQKLSEDSAQLFLGIRTQCAQCHNHPFDRWTMDDYYSWMSFFTGVRRKHGAEAREYYVYNDNLADPAGHPIDGRPMAARFLGGGPAEVEGRDPRRALAAWLAAPENRFFRRSLANRIWAHFFGRGIVDPVDDFRVSNQPSNEPLLEELGRRLAEEHRFDMRALIRDICNSRTYQLSSRTNASNRDDDRHCSHAQIRRLRADVLLDCMAAATETRLKFRRSTSERAVTLFQGFYGENFNQYFLTTFGQATRETVCACEDRSEANLSQALHLLNGDTLNRKTIDVSPVIDRLLADKVPDDEAIAALYVRALTRQPTPDERRAIVPVVAAATDDRGRREVLQDLYWALLNSDEFIFNH